MTHYILTPQGRKDAPAPKDGKHYTLEELYSILKCDYVQFINVGDVLFICDEDAKLKNVTSVNREATAMAISRGAIFSDDCFAGDVLVCDHQLIQ